MSAQNNYPNWMRPLTVPIRAHRRVQLGDIEQCYQAFLDHIKLNTVYRIDDNVIVLNYEQWGLTIPERFFTIELEQNSLPLLPLNDERFNKENLKEFFTIVDNHWPLFNSAGKRTVGFKALCESTPQVSFTQPYFSKGDPVPAEALPVLETLTQHNIYLSSEFHDEIVKTSGNKTINFNITRAIQRDHKWREYVEIIPCLSHEFLKRNYTKYYPVGLTALAVSPASVGLTSFLPLAGDIFVSGVAILGALGAGAALWRSHYLYNKTYFGLTSKGETLLEQLKAWDTFRKTVDESAAYTQKP